MGKYQIMGLSCAHCAQKLEHALSKRAEVERFELNFSAQKLKLKSQDPQATIDFIENFEDGIKVIKVGSEHHEHQHDHQKYALIKVVLSGLLFVFSLFATGNIQIVGLLLAYIIVSYSVIIKAIKNLLKGNLFDEFFLMSLATIAAIGIGELSEAVAVMFFYSIGELFQERALDNSRKAISDLLELHVDKVRIVSQNITKLIEPDLVPIGTKIIVKSGEKVPIDGYLLRDQALINTAALTGESRAKKFSQGELIYAGMISEGQTITIKTKASYANSAIAKMLEMVESASERKTKTERFITEFARVYTPIVISLAVLMVALLPMFGVEFNEAIYRAVILLVISCPCALVISVPLGYFAGIGRAAQKGVLIKGANYLDQLASMDTLMLDKTGTITKGNFTVTNVDYLDEEKRDEINEVVLSAENESNHPIAKALVQNLSTKWQLITINDLVEIKGKGLKAYINDNEYLIGSEQFLKDNNIQTTVIGKANTQVLVARNQQHVCTFYLADEIKADSKAAISSFKYIGIDNVIMLTGDKSEVAQIVASEVGTSDYVANLLPEDKVEQVVKAIEQEQKVGFVGDGINDAPVIARADVGIAMGLNGSDIAIETADVVINNDSLTSLLAGINIARFSKKIIAQNIIFALTIKVLIISLGIFGNATMWEAVFADVGVSLIAILNSLRIMKK